MTARRALLGAVVLGLLAWLTTGVTTIHPGERGVALRYGSVHGVLSPGLHLTLPWPIDEVRRVDVELSRRMPLGYRLVDAERNIDPRPNEVQWLTGDTNIVELRANVLYRVDDPVAWLFGVSDSAGDEGHRSFTLRRLGESVLTRLIASTPVQDVLSRGVGGFQVRARERLQAAADAVGLGVRVSSIEVVEATAPLMVISSFNRVNDARQEASRLLVEAEGDRRARIQHAESEAARRIGRAREFAAERLGAARGFVQQLEALHPEELAALSATALENLWYDRMRAVLGRLRVVPLPASADGAPVEYWRRR